MSGVAPPPAVPAADRARALGDPTRHEIFDYIAEADRDVGVAELTAHVGLNHNAVRQHLAKLLAAGLVVETREQRSRPGRPRLLYRVAPAVLGEWAAAGAYERLAVWLTGAVSAGITPEEAGRRAGRAEARPRPDQEPVEQLAAEMARHGFDPVVRTRRRGPEIVLRACPYAEAVLTDADVVCSLHRGLAAGAAEAIGGVVVDDLIPHDPRRAGCRLLVSPADDPGGRDPTAG